MADNSEIRYLNPIDIEVKKTKYCRYKDYWNKTIDDCFYKIYPKDILSKFNYED